MSTLVRDVALYNAKVWAAGLVAAILVPLSLVGLALDVLFGTTDDDRSLARRVLRTSAEVEAQLDIHGDLTDVTVVDEPDHAALRPARVAAR